jgi:hypothetical protein
MQGNWTNPFLKFITTMSFPFALYPQALILTIFGFFLGDIMLQLMSVFLYLGQFPLLAQSCSLIAQRPLNQSPHLAIIFSSSVVLLGF